jgi:hypothetical protein
MESALPAAGFLYWVGASTLAYAALRISYSLFLAFRVWGVGNEAGVGPWLGEWAGESDAAPRLATRPAGTGVRPALGTFPRGAPAPPVLAPRVLALPPVAIFGLA